MKKKWILLLLITISFTSLTAQDALYPNTFPLGDVRITAGRKRMVTGKKTVLTGISVGTI